jgi:DnaJ-class molecular chaperone
MSESHDLLAHAYATLGLPPWCSKRETSRQYKKLVKRWHPDQYANDPQGQAEAAQRMREINRAYGLIQQARREGRVPRSQPVPASDAGSRPRSRFFGQHLSDADRDEIVDAIGTPQFGAFLGNYLFWAFSCVIGCLMVLGGLGSRGRPPNAMNVAAGVVLLSVAAVHFVRTMRGKNH